VYVPVLLEQVPRIYSSGTDARKHHRLLQQIVQHRRLMIFATKPPIEALSNPEVLTTIPGISSIFEPDLPIVQELLDELTPGTKDSSTMSIRDYWHLPPDQQAALRALILVDPAPPAVAPTEQSESSLAHTCKAIYARDLIANLGAENVDQRSDDEVIANPAA